MAAQDCCEDWEHICRMLDKVHFIKESVYKASGLYQIRNGFITSIAVVLIKAVLCHNELNCFLSLKQKDN